MSAGRLERMSWLMPGLLVALARLHRDPAEPLKLVAERDDGQLIELDTRGQRFHEQQTILLTAVIPHELSVDRLTGLLIEDGAGPRALECEDLAALVSTPVELATTAFAEQRAEVRAVALNFLLAAPAAHGVDPDPELSARLALLRDVLRQPLPVTSLEPATSCAVRFESVHAIDERAFWLSGWIHDPLPHDGRLTVVTPEGVRVEPPLGAISFHGRPDVDRVFAESAAGSVGFEVYVELDRPSHAATGWVVEFRSAAGLAVEDAARAPVGADRTEPQRRIMTVLGAEQADQAVLANQVLPALSRLRQGGDIEIDQIADYGQLPSAPEFSIVIALRHIDRIQHQLVEFAQDPELAAAEILYVAPPAAAAALRKVAPQWQQLYRVPFRVVELTGGARRPRAINLGAAVARGRLLVSMSRDVFPSAPGWLGRLRELHEQHANIGAVAPMLLHHDGSIAHAGAQFTKGSDGACWERTLPLRGLSATVPAARGPRRVQAISDACMMITADAFRACEGLSELYFDGADECAELCLRLAGDGLEVWLADVSLYWLEHATSWPQNPSRVAARFNDWLFDRRWGARLTAADGRGAAATVTVHEPGSELGFPTRGSGRPGAPLEILDVIRAHPDESWVLDAELLRPAPGTEWESYAHTYAFTVQGWALARNGAPVTVELREGQRVLRHAVTSLKRDDVANKYPDAPGADAAGFQTAVGTLGLAPRFQVTVDLLTADGRRTLLATIEGRRRPVRSSFKPLLQPALITTLGRTGSSWLALLLSRHPQIVAYRPFQNEARVASYWMEVLRALAEPSSYIQALRPELYQGHWWLGDERPSPLPLHLAEPQMPQWLGGENVEILAGFCQSRVDDFYSRLARIEEQPSPRYFAEKCWPNEVTPELLGELYPDGREILLVRDFRDMVCSIMGFNAKRGFASFGREVTDSDEAFIRYLRESALRMLESWNDRRERAHLVRYEDLILEPEATLAGAFSYLELEADPGTVRRTIVAANNALPHVQRAHQTSTSVVASVGRWKHELSEEHQAICHEAFGDILTAFGYEPTTQISSNDRSATSSITASGASTSSS